jgi:hypothetical protein
MLYHGLFARFDRDGSGKVDRLGFLTEQMVFEEGSFLKVGVDRELGQLAKAA